MKELLLKFKFNNKVYAIYLTNNEYIGCRIDGNKLYTKLDKDEVDLLNHVFNSLIPEKEDYINKISFNNAKIVLLYDQDKKIYSFKYEDGTNLSKTDIRALNILFNNQKDVVYNRYQEKNEYITRYIKYGKKVIVVLVSATMVLSSGCTLKNSEKNDLEEKESFEQVVENDKEIATIEIDNTQDSESTVLNQEDLKDEYNYISSFYNPHHFDNLTSDEKIQTLKDLINMNSYLTSDEKQFFLDNFNIVEANIDNIPFDQVAHTFRFLRIEYKEGLIDNSSYGSLNQRESLMQIGNSNDFNSAKKEVILHEFSHTLESWNRDYRFEYIFEALNSIYNNEYFGTIYNPEDYTSFDWGYTNKAKDYVYVLTEILGSDVMESYHFNQDSQILIDEMNRYLKDTNKSNQILIDMNYLATGSYMVIDREKTINELYSLLEELYIDKYGTSMETNMEIMVKLKPSYVAEMINYQDEYSTDDKGVVKVGKQKIYFNKNHENYLKPSTYQLFREVKNYKAIYTIEQALSYGLIEEKDGKYHTLKEGVKVNSDGSVEEFMKYYFDYTELDIDDDYLKENIK